jgi:hypothetical protein
MVTGMAEPGLQAGSPLSVPLTCGSAVSFREGLVDGPATQVFGVGEQVTKGVLLGDPC